MKIALLLFLIKIDCLISETLQLLIEDNETIQKNLF